jgi:diguanylate cyclase (GGDEF)-like protein
MAVITDAAAATIDKIRQRAVAEASVNVGVIAPSLVAEAMYLCWSPDPATLPDQTLAAAAGLPADLFASGVAACRDSVARDHGALLDHLIILTVVDDGADVSYLHYGAAIQATSRVSLSGTRQSDWLARTAIAYYYIATYRAILDCGRALYTENISAPQFAAKTWVRLTRPIRTPDGRIEGFLVALAARDGLPTWPAVQSGDATAPGASEASARHNRFVIASCHAAMRFSEASSTTLLDEGPTPLALLVPDLSGVRYVNKRFLAATGLRIEEIALFQPERLFAVPQVLRDAVRQSAVGPVRDLDAVLQRVDGTPIYASIHLSRVEHVGGQTVALWLHDVTARRQLEGELRALSRDLAAERDELARLKSLAELDARHDPITKLYNRRAIEELLEGEIDLARREERPVWIAYLDLDHFRAVNDQHGPAVGDRVLREAAWRVRGVLRGADLIGRMGGDEFAVLLRGRGRSDGTPASALRAAARMIQALGQPFDLAGGPVVLGASIGIAGFPLHADDAASLVRQADSAMYLAKGAGRGCAIVAAEPATR